MRQIIKPDTPLPEIVDRLAKVQTAIAVLESLEKNLKAALISTGLQEVCGLNVRAVISRINSSVTIDYRGVVQSMNVPPALLKQYEKEKPGYNVVRLFGYN